MFISLKKYKDTVYFRGSIAAVDQGLISLINFGVQIMLIRYVSKNEYGLYSLAVSIILYLTSFQNAIVNTPMTVTLAGKQDVVRKKYTSAIFSGQLLGLGALGILGVVVMAIVFYSKLSSIESLISMSICIASFGVLNREFLRAYFYADERPLKVLKLDASYVLIYIILLIFTFSFIRVSVPLIILFMGISSGFDSLILSKSMKFNFNLSEIKKSFLENWYMSKWSLVGVTVNHLQNNSYLYIIGTILGTKAMADVSASRLLLMPLGLIVTGWGNVIRPYGAKLRELNQLKKFFRILLLTCLIFPLVVLFLILTLKFMENWLLIHILHSKYSDIFDYLYFWGAITSFDFIRASADYGLQVIKRFKSIAVINFITAIIVISSSFILTSSYGIKGALIASLSGVIIFAATLWYFLYKSIFKKASY